MATTMKFCLKIHGWGSPRGLTDYRAHRLTTLIAISHTLPPVPLLTLMADMELPWSWPPRSHPSPALLATTGTSFAPPTDLYNRCSWKDCPPKRGSDTRRPSIVLTTSEQQIPKRPEDCDQLMPSINTQDNMLLSRKWFQIQSRLHIMAYKRPLVSSPSCSVSSPMFPSTSLMI